LGFAGGGFGDVGQLGGGGLIFGDHARLYQKGGDHFGPVFQAVGVFQAIARQFGQACQNGGLIDGQILGARVEKGLRGGVNAPAVAP
jgi:hypothetical protein